MIVRAATAAVGMAAAGVAARRATHTWGATAAEQHELLPGDELVAEPAIVSTRAVTIDAPVGEVWSWLVQIGQNRGGMYSYDGIENLIGLDIHSTDAIRPEWQKLEPGDRIVLVPAGWAGRTAGYELPVAQVDPPSTLVLRQSPPEHPWDAVWSFHVRALADGRSRLISRGRSRRRRGGPGILDLAIDTLMDPVSWLMTRKMLLGIKQRAERRGTTSGSDLRRGETTGHRDRAPGASIERRLERDIARLHRQDQAPGAAVVTESDLDALPEPAQRYMRWMGVPDRPPVCAFRAHFRGEIRRRPGARWVPYDAWQYNRGRPITRLVRMQIKAGGVLPMFGTDTYVDQTGRMLGKLLGEFDPATMSFDTGPMISENEAMR